MTEQWERWTPREGLAQKYDITSVIDTYGGLQILLTDSDNAHNQLKILFDGFVGSYIKTNETFRLTKVNELGEKYDAFYGNWTFFKVTNSEYLKWLSDQSYTWSDYILFIHFAFIGSNSILDVLAPSEPKVELIVV